MNVTNVTAWRQAQAESAPCNEDGGTETYHKAFTPSAIHESVTYSTQRKEEKYKQNIHEKAKKTVSDWVIQKYP
jgi:hypothetical protein